MVDVALINAFKVPGYQGENIYRIEKFTCFNNMAARLFVYLAVSSLLPRISNNYPGLWGIK
jgi:hypothetical protein